MDILSQAMRNLGKTAVISANRRYTYDQILQSSDSISRHLLDVAPKLPGADPPRVGIYSAPGAEYLAGTLAIWKAGCIAVPLAVSHPPRELAYVLQDSGITAVLSNQESASKLSQVSTEARAHLHIMDSVDSTVLLPSDNTSSALSGRFGFSSVDQENREAPHQLDPKPSETGALIIYTSGTTGKPKGVLHSHRSLRAQIHGLVQAWRWSSQDTILHTLPLHHIHGIVNALYCPAFVGATTSFMPKFSAVEVWNEIMAGHVSVFMGVPTMYSFLLAHYDQMSSEQQALARQSAAALRLTISGSSACPVPIMNKWKELSGKYLLERYGMTEIGMALSNPYEGERRPGTVGAPLPGVTVRIQDDGELLVKGDYLFSKYWGREEATREAFTSDGYFKTGDSAELTSSDASERSDDSSLGSIESSAVHQYYQIMGRTSVDIIKSAGYKISALMVESVILEYPGVSEVAVLGVPEEVYGEVVTALVALKPGSKSVTQKDLTGFCRERLAPYQAPKRWKFVESLPRNAMGKLNKKELLKTILETGQQEKSVD
ncbi:hypothetical protein CEUSTIGMA_g11270.t1 [Chlamydomonas eustigma]|uniref:AMP-dependent synthetase/ligase domain-containing protein n=1 Tax=Chlamydomonas eustigma TaxID=1157962 RepID=A0A250XLD4_9CHLO|nr:hypothetical protein CEUSTIGMA_g11270.t1 [Chlamydomonas eustigma]|eukprot:GAX83846.1 hypothetical protein CEUSTIGMA_g11270.t1 [Chlamydomonas eustigma]